MVFGGRNEKGLSHRGGTRPFPYSRFRLPHSFRFPGGARPGAYTVVAQKTRVKVDKKPLAFPNVRKGAARLPVAKGSENTDGGCPLGLSPKNPISILHVAEPVVLINAFLKGRTLYEKNGNIHLSQRLPYAAMLLFPVDIQGAIQWYASRNSEGGATPAAVKW